MSSRFHRRQVLLFLVAVFVPSLVLVALSLRMISQERELAEKRARDEQQRRIGEVRQELLTRLERIKLQEARTLAERPDAAALNSYAAPEVVFVGWVENDRLVLPWERNRAAENAQRLLDESPFAQIVQLGEDEELATKRFEKAADLYRQAMRAARHPTQAAYTELLLARVLTRLGREDEAAAHYRKILSTPTDVIDEQGVPFSFYAAERLIGSGADEVVLQLIRRELATRRWLPPVEVYAIRELANKLATTSEGQFRASAEEVGQQVNNTAHDLEQVLALRDDFSGLNLMQSVKNQSWPPEPLWIPYGGGPWLVSVSPDLVAQRPVAVAVRAEAVLASLESARPHPDNSPIKLITGDESKGEPLGSALPGLRLAFIGSGPDTSRPWTLQQAFYFVALLLVVSMTSFGAYLLWRDVRREMRLVELRSQFVSSVSHELKTPLTAIRMFAETLRMGRPADSKTRGEYLDTIVNESERLTRLLNSVLDFSKIEQGKKTYHLTPTSLPEVVQASAQALEYPLAQQGFELRVAVEGDIPAVRADRDALQQAILNLLTNAMKYSSESREIDLRLRRRNGEAVIQVTDRGIGIAPEEQARIFEKFYRGPATENKLIPGTGLGLTLVDHVVKAHGGRVEVRSAPHKGSTFSIHLPLGGEA
jgi:signal transduction histidine kinase/tetratricopeptide (TPR) repeat protein